MVNITTILVHHLIEEQFPEWKDFAVKPVKRQGNDNCTFRLGKKMLTRLPSSEGYSAQPQKEQRWVPQISDSVSLHVPKLVGAGKPSAIYPWHWSIYEWMEGKSASETSEGDVDLEHISEQLAEFLCELHAVDISHAPEPGLHNYYRGAHLSVYDEGTRTALRNLEGVVDVQKLMTIWEKALDSRWQNIPVWVHGDFSAGNMLIKDNKVSAIIDFGCIAVGDPACDLVIAWTFLKGESREIFKRKMCMDKSTWERARGWALWKSVITLADIKDKSSAESMVQKRIIEELID